MPGGDGPSTAAPGPDPAAARIAGSFARQGLMRTLGATLERVGDGEAVIAAPLTAAVSQHHGYGHAGLTFALGDTAAGYAALTAMPEGAEVLTVEMKINLTAPATGERLVATGRVARAGRRVVIVTAEVVAEPSGRTVALLQGTMLPA